MQQLGLLRALDYEKRTMDCILKIIILVATFNIIATLFMVVTEKTRDIGLLRASARGVETSCRYLSCWV
jgi:ABC-type lipoprotein release transport system permease subunit